MRESQALLVMNMLVSELGYTVEWIRLPDGSRSESFRLDNHKGESREFGGTDKFVQAMQWLRQKA